jgi:prophage DNA circulation protein
MVISFSINFYSLTVFDQGDVEKLQIHRRKYKERFNTNVDKLSDKLSDMDGRIADVNAQYNVLCDQVADAIDVDIPDLQGQVEALQDQMDAISPIFNMTSEPPLHEREDVKASIQTLQSLVAGKSGR